MRQHRRTAFLRWLIAHQHVSASAAFGLLVFLYLAPVLVGGDVLSPAAALYQFPPWRSAAPDGIGTSINFILGDVPMSHYPLNVLAREFIYDGVVPLWSQHAYAGVPFFANPQTVLLSPFSLPMWILPLDYGVGVMGAVKLWCAAFGTYLLIRELRIGFWPGLLAGFSYALSSFSVLWLGHETLLGVAVMLPWMVWLAERIAVTGRPWPAVGLALVTAIMLTGGHPGTMVHVAVAVALYAVVRVTTVCGVATAARVRRVAAIYGSMLLGAVLVAVLLLPVVAAADGTIGQEARLGENSTIPGAELPLETIRTVLFPDWWGRPSRLSLEGPANYNERTFYAGGVATVFAVLALVSSGAWRRKIPFAVLVCIGLAVPLHVPGLYWLAKHLPLLGQVQHQRMMLLYVFGVAVLGAFGMQQLLDAPRERKRRWAVLGAAATAGIVAVSTATPSSEDVWQAFENIAGFDHAQGSLTGGETNLGGTVATSVGWWLLIVVVIALLVAALWRWPSRWPAVAVGISLIAAVDLLYFARDYQPMGPRELLHPPKTETVEYLQREGRRGRVVGVDGALLPNWNAIYGVQDLRGVDPPQPDRRWYRMWQVVHPEQLNWAQAMMSLPDQRGLDVLSVLGARYIVTDPDIAADTALPQLRAGYAGGDAIVWTNPEAVPRVMIPRRVLASSGEAETIQRITAPAFAAQRQVVVERGEPSVALRAGRGTVAVVAETNTSVTLRASMVSGGLVVLNDRLAPGWHVEVDGRSVDAVRVNGVMRGVVVPRGTHEIVWRYAAPGLRAGAVTSLVGLFALVAACALASRWARRT